MRGKSCPYMILPLRSSLDLPIAPYRTVLTEFQITISIDSIKKIHLILIGCWQGRTRNIETCVSWTSGIPFNRPLTKQNAFEIWIHQKKWTEMLGRRRRRRRRRSKEMKDEPVIQVLMYSDLHSWARDQHIKSNLQLMCFFFCLLNNRHYFVNDFQTFQAFHRVSIRKT